MRGARELRADGAASAVLLGVVAAFLVADVAAVGALHRLRCHEPVRAEVALPRSRVQVHGMEAMRLEVRRNHK